IRKSITAKIIPPILRDSLLYTTLYNPRTTKTYLYSTLCFMSQKEINGVITDLLVFEEPFVYKKHCKIFLLPHCCQHDSDNIKS
ncbi:FXYD domain containing ion transport regulator 6 like precursor, partial [Triplophysa rosa]